jgi:transposase-like protein
VSVRELAERVGCSREAVYSWRRRLTTSDASASSRRCAGLVRVQVTEPAPEPDTGLLEVRTRSGRSVLVPPGFDPSALAAVVAVLERC